MSKDDALSGIISLKQRHTKIFYRTVFVVIAFSFSLVFSAESKAVKVNINADFITCVIPDGSGGAFIGSEDDGVFHCDSQNKIIRYTTKNGLGDDNAYALAVDKLGRLWVGHQSSGVSVFNGKEWKNYDVVDGPIGERIFDIQVCPVDGDVWMATSAGITRYKMDADEWKHYTREDGLLEDQCSSLAFQQDGTLLIGTQCHGLAIFTRDKDGNYTHAKNITAPERYGKKNESPVPLTPRGDGLPSDCVNKILVSTDKVWIATTAGLVTADNTLTKLRYVRGVDYVDKVKGLYGGAPKEWEECTPKAKTQFLPEDYVTSLCTIDGKLYIGMRQKGLSVFDKTGKPLQQQYTNKNGLSDNYVSVLYAHANHLYIGTYGGGLCKVSGLFTSQVVRGEKQKTVKLPSPIKPPTIEELKEMFYKLKEHKTAEHPPKIAALNDDWRTKGDWIDRVGNYSAVLCAMAGGGIDFFSGYQDNNSRFSGWIGRNYKEKGDVIRRWVHWLESKDQRVLQSKSLGGRKQSEWDDHKEVYPLTLDGPHIYGTFTLPPGKYIMSLYFFNKDGHEGKNRLRDYVITVKTAEVPKELLGKLGRTGYEAEDLFLSTKGGAKSRVKDFWGGVWKRFYVEVGKDESVMLKIDAAYSHNTIVSAVMFDPAVSMDLIPSGSMDPPPPTPRKVTDWAVELENVQKGVWRRVNALDQMLLLRDSDPVWYHARENLLPLFRALVEMKNGLPYAPKVFDADTKKRFRSDTGTLAGDLQFFDVQDKIDFARGEGMYYSDDGLKYQRYRWEDRTRLGRDREHESNWDDGKYRQFLEKNINKQTW